MARHCEYFRSAQTLRPSHVTVTVTVTVMRAAAAGVVVGAVPQEQFQFFSFFNIRTPPLLPNDATPTQDLVAYPRTLRTNWLHLAPRNATCNSPYVARAAFTFPVCWRCLLSSPPLLLHPLLQLLLLLLLLVVVIAVVVVADTAARSHLTLAAASRRDTGKPGGGPPPNGRWRRATLPLAVGQAKLGRGLPSTHNQE